MLSFERDKRYFFLSMTSVHLCLGSSDNIQSPEVGRKYEREIKQVSSISFV